MEIVTQIVEILVAGLKGMASGVGTGLNELVKSVFLTTTGEGAAATTALSVFGSVIIAFGGVALAIGLSKFIVNWLTSFGN